MALALLAGCAGAKQDPLARDVARLQEDVRGLRAQRDADRRRIDALEAQLAGLARKGGRAAVPRDLAVVRVEPDAAPDEEGSAFVADVSDDAPSRPRAAARLAEGGPTGGVDAAPSIPTDVELREPSELAGPPPAYVAARDALSAGDAARAAALFEAFVAGAPQDPLADNALVAQGDALVQAGQPARALAAYERVATGYPAGDAVPEALLRYGETCLSLGRKAAAKAAFRRVVEDHPGSAPAEAAKGRLAGL
jgi:TolA-binding protein